MNMIVFVTLALVACAAAAPPANEAQVLSYKIDQQPQGSYNFEFSIDNSIARQEIGELTSVLDAENKPHDVITVRGSYTQLDNEGRPQTINYFADGSGYHAEGPAVPKAPVARR